MKTFSYSIAVFLLTLVLFASCNQNDKGVTPSQIDTKLLDSQLASDNYFRFTSFQAFEDSIRILSTLSNDQLNMWEKQQGFVSMRSLYLSLEDYYIRREAHYVKLIESGRTDISATDFATSSYIERLNGQFSFDTESGLSYKLFNIEFAKFLNRHGVVKIGSSLYQFNRTGVKAILNGDAKEIPNLAKVFNKATETENLKVSEAKLYNFRTEGDGSNLRTTDSYQRCEAQTGSSNGSLKLIGESGAYTILMPAGGGGYNYTIGATVAMHFLRKSIFGWNNHKSENYSVTGSWNILAPAGGNCPNISQQGPWPITGGHTNFAGHTSQPVLALYPRCTLGYVLTGTVYIQPLALWGTHNYQFVDLGCTTTN